MIELRNIHKSYGSLEVLKGIFLTIPRGEVVAIVGPSGAGKSTLLQIMGTLDQPTSGTVSYDGDDLRSLSDSQLSHFRNSNIGFVFQQHRLLPEFTLLENVMLSALIGGMAAKEAEAKAKELIKMVGLSGRIGHKPGELSGGECQRTAVARALINSPKVVLADEPSGSLDSRNREELHALFFEINRTMGTTFAIVTHDDSLASLCHKIIHLRDGQIQSISGK